MRVLIDIGHPAHVHFFRNPMSLLEKRGHDILVTSRVKEMTIPLLDSMGIEHKILSTHGDGSIGSMLKELVSRDYALYKVARKFKPDVLTEIGGIFVAHVGALIRKPSVVFYDTENAKLQNALTYPLADCLVVPECYQGPTPERKTIHYPGYHELSYLHPSRFKPDRYIAEQNGLDAEKDTFFLRLVSWNANHDLSESGWSTKLLGDVVEVLKPHGKILISSEADLPNGMRELAYRGDSNFVHHVLAFCRGFIGESATMASECAVLGIPAVYAANTGRGYTDEQEKKYNLVKNVRTLGLNELRDAIQWIIDYPEKERIRAQQQLISSTVDVAQFIVDCIEDYESYLLKYKKGTLFT